MKKIFLLTFCLLIIPKFAFALDCGAVGGKRINSSGFVYFDGQKGKFINGFEIEDPANKIIIIFFILSHPLYQAFASLNFDHYQLK